MVATRFSEENICLIAKILKKDKDSVFCCQCMLDCRKNYRQEYTSIRSSKPRKKKKKRKTNVERCCNTGCKNKADGIPPPISIAESYYCMGCFAIYQERFGVDNTGFEDDKEIQILEESRCSTHGCENMTSGKLLSHPKTNEYLCVKCYLAFRPKRVCHLCYTNFKWERND